MSHREEMAKAAKAAAAAGEKTVFTKIIDGEIPADFIHKDHLCVAFMDMKPRAPVHFLVIPRKPLPMLDSAEDEDSALLGHLLIVAKNMAAQLSLDRGYRVVINNGVEVRMPSTVSLLFVRTFLFFRALSLFTTFTSTFWVAVK
jgi:histidine triad (HIT) family protein